MLSPSDISGQTIQLYNRFFADTEPCRLRGEKMKRKKMLLCFLALLMILAISAPVFAAGVDMTAPLLNSLTFSGAEVKTPGTVEGRRLNWWRTA